MLQFFNSKRNKKIAGLIIGILVFAMIITTVISVTI